MNEYLMSVVLVGAVATLASLFLPEGDDRMRRLLEFGFALLILLVILRPLPGLLGEDFGFPDLFPPAEGSAEEDLPEETWSQMEAAVAEGIEKDIASRYNLPPSCIRADVELRREGDGLLISSLLLTFTGEGRLADLYAIRAYAEKNYQTVCEVKSDGG